jgi:hypothetical protein
MGDECEDDSSLLAGVVSCQGCEAADYRPRRLDSLSVATRARLKPLGLLNFKLILNEELPLRQGLPLEHF